MGMLDRRLARAAEALAEVQQRRTKLPGNAVIQPEPHSLGNSRRLASLGTIRLPSKSNIKWRLGLRGMMMVIQL